MQKIGVLFSRKVHQTRAGSEGYKTFLEMTTCILSLTPVRGSGLAEGRVRIRASRFWESETRFWESDSGNAF